MAVKTTEGWVPNEVTTRIGARVKLEDVVQDIDWDLAIMRLSPPPMPDYVRSSIHGLAGGYSTPVAAATWDPVVKEIFAEYYESEETERDEFCSQATSFPRRILDVACGTGESTLAWRRRFPKAEITAIDVSPYMLALAERKLAADRMIEVRCLNAEELPLADGSFDLVSASLLFHEVPENVAPRILREMRRVCRPGGEIAVMEPYRVGGRALKPIPFPEPYLKDYLATDWDVAFKAAGFGAVQTVEYENGWSRTGTAF
jgi:ubiquinone/menaquinone biosynthesis C-methylase UbiE